ncbi:hypothetical protein L7F22_032947 [Adiantum nelumboides]|nr:hypothetical protein [Adiantum nelumboides]
MLQVDLVSPSSYLSLLKACHSTKALHHVHDVHAHIICHGFPLAGLLGDYLIVTYAKCGALNDACLISGSLSCRTVFSWSSLISAYADCGRSHEALQLHQLMAAEGIEANDYTFVSLLKACANTCNLELGRKLHADLCIKGFVSDHFVANTLVSMYGKCGKTTEAEEVFQGLSLREVVSWTAMISAYVEVGLGEEALLAYRQMQEESVTPNKSTLVMILQACYCLVEREEALGLDVISPMEVPFEIGQACHVEAQRLGLMPDALLSNTLVTTYSKCGAVQQAEAALGTLRCPHIVSWNAMLSAYIQHGEGKRALQLFQKMHIEGVIPELHTFVFALQACSILTGNEDASIAEGLSATEVALGIGLCLHEDTCRKGCSSDVFVGTALLNMFGKAGRVLDAETVFTALSYHDLASCNAMLIVYAERSEGNKALRLYGQICEDGMYPNQLTFVACLQACGTLDEEEADVDGGKASIKAISFEIVQALHSDALSKSYVSNVLVANTLISIYGKLGAVRDAQEVFCALPERTVVSWTTMLSIYAEQNLGLKALHLFLPMQEENTGPNQLMYVAGLQACVSLGGLVDITEDLTSIKAKSLEIGQALHADAYREGFMSDVLVSSTILSMYGRCGSLWKAESVFNLLPYCHIDTCNAMLSLYVAEGEGENALFLYRTMQQEFVPLTCTTLISALQACSEIAHVETSYELHFDILCLEFDWFPLINATLIHAYGSSASMVDAQVVLDTTPQAQVGSWTSCIAGYSGAGNPIGTLQMLEDLQLMGKIPNKITLISALSACNRGGLICDGIEYLMCLSEKKGLNLESKHYSILVDLFGRAGDFNRVRDILLNMPMQPDLMVWSCLLAVCRLHCHVELAEQAFEHITKCQPQWAAPYLLEAKK